MTEFQIENLLGREPILINTESIRDNLQGKRVMITGAAGSIGSEIVRQISRFNPKELVLCDMAESPLYDLQLELQDSFPGLSFYPVISDVRNRKRMATVFEKYRPDYIYHAAAYKHVPLMEEHPSECVLTNIEGTKNVADLALEYNVEAFVLISTDKAVNPTNVMGTTKRVAEIYIQYLSEIQQKNLQINKKTRFIITRFGNVLGSSGSVVQRFQQQIEKGGPVTVTHPDIIRYFMTIPEACRLVLEAGNMGQGGEIFIFDMGQPIKIVELAERMIRQAGYIPNKEIEIIFTGLRPGEKLHEELLAAAEETSPTYHPKILIGKVRNCSREMFLPDLSEIIFASASYDEKKVLRLLEKMVPEFVRQIK